MIPINPTNNRVGVERMECNVRLNICADETRNISAEIVGYLVDEAGMLQERITCIMTPEEYSAWGADDDYPTLLLIEKNGLTAQQ